jgi:ribulose-bisphosphate carboxylase large chain
MNFYQRRTDIDADDYVIASYIIKSSTSVKDAAWNLIIGQSVGNPNIRNTWETDQLFETHSCIILDDPVRLSQLKEATVEIAFPIVNIDWATDGISQLLCHLMGGHTDIDIITGCRLINLELPTAVRQNFKGPKFGLTGIRTFTGQHGKPLFGSIIKPKIGLDVSTLVEVVKQLVDGGVDFIKEDEIMSNPSCAPLDRRVDAVANFLAKQNRKIVFCHTINSDPHIVIDRVKRVYDLGGNGVHINVFSGLGVYNSIRKLDLPLFLHFQKSGSRVFADPSNRYSIAWPVICQLATLMGVDTIQTGMLGGYSNDDPEELETSINILRQGNTLPVLSCGMHPGLIDSITEQIGIDYMANAGGAVHGHTKGTLHGALAMRYAIDNIV